MGADHRRLQLAFAYHMARQILEVDEEFLVGEQRFLEQLEEGRLLSPAELERRILADVAAFGGEPHDDTTLLILRM